MADNLGDVSANAKLEKRKTAIFKEVEGELIPAMEFLAKESKENDAVYRSVRALMLMRKGGESNIREARDSFDVVIDRGMGSSHTSDMILSLDMQLNDKEHAEERASRVLAIRPDDPLANYIMGSIVLHRGDNEAAEKYFKKAVSGKRVIPLAFNDMAEVLRRRKAFDEAEVYARKAVEQMPNLYVAWETLGSILMDAGKSFDEAEKYVQKACDLSKNEQGGAADVRMLISLARVQIRRNQMNRAQVTIREVQRRLNELTDFEKQEFQELMKSVK
jgi:Tfp pilus assembly protein PilF